MVTTICKKSTDCENIFQQGVDLPVLLLYSSTHAATCGLLGEMMWPFPTPQNPATPWTPKQIREYQKQMMKNAPTAPMMVFALGVDMASMSQSMQTQD